MDKNHVIKKQRKGFLLVEKGNCYVFLSAFHFNEK